MRSDLHEPKAHRGPSPLGKKTASRASNRQVFERPGLAPRLVDAALAADSDNEAMKADSDKPSFSTLAAELRELQARQEEVLALLANALP